MTVRAPKTRWIVLLGLAGVLAAGRAYAQTTPCATDLDCPGTGCGGQVCVKSSGGAMCADPNTSHASGIDDGWCAAADGTPTDTNCKCHSLGATCNGFYCTFTIPPDGGATGTGGGGGSGGSTGTGGSGKGGSGTGTGGSATGTGGTSGGSGGGGGGCSVAGTPSALGAAGSALLLALALVRRRRR
ncbi:MAG TPA: MYXO-CTERM sorting domain-containing protein [Polyangia bacterium]|nr:MYXO-CTERM sorting domain-containing protein [Polyangia bacterium]